MGPHEFEPLAADCERFGVREFLESDQYCLDDADLIAHLDTCPACRNYLQSQAGNVQHWQQAKRFLQPTEFDQAGKLEFSAATCSGGGANQPAAVSEVLESLTPSEDPHHLGRLGTYEITGVVGVGGMGVVLKAIDPSLDRVVAVKVMNPRLANNENARRRFAREAKAAAAVLHPNVIPIHSVSSGSSLPYLVMSYIRGGSLQKRLEHEGALPLVEVLRIGSQIAAGLNAAHEQGLIHRDIKPENILLEEGVERVTITDFGLARAVDDNTITQFGSIAGTPQYMSPEQARGDALDQQSDLFSLGSVLYALCTGRPPFSDDTSYGVMRRIIDEKPTAIRLLNHESPDWMIAIVETLMAKHKIDRYASAHEVHVLLETCLSHVQQPAGNPLPATLHIRKIHVPARKSMKFISGAVILSFVLLTVYLGQMVRSVQTQSAIQAERVVSGPLGDLEGYVTSMMKSPYDLVFLNLGAIGKDQNYLTIHPTNTGVSMVFPAYDTSSWNRRQGKYVETLNEVAKAIGVPRVESSKMSPDGSVKAVDFEYTIDGDPAQVADTIAKIITRTFGVGLSAQCEFQYHNMPSVFSVREGEEPKRVSSSEFLAEARKGNRIYLGEREANIYLLPPAQISNDSIQWNGDIWFTDVRELPSEFVRAIRTSTITTSQMSKNQVVSVNSHDKSRNDLTALEGVWQVTYPEDSGRVAPMEMLQKLRFTFVGSKLTTEINGRKSVSTLRLDPTRSPKTIDLTEDGRTKLGIYALEGDRLRMSLAEFLDQRPTSFASETDEPADLVIELRRVATASQTEDAIHIEDAAPSPPIDPAK